MPRGSKKPRVAGSALGLDLAKACVTDDDMTVISFDVEACATGNGHNEAPDIDLMLNIAGIKKKMSLIKRDHTHYLV